MPDDKIQLRIEARERLKQMDSVDKKTASQVIASRIVALSKWKSARNVFLFAALSSEPNLSDLWLPRNRGKRNFFLPRLVADGMEMVFHLSNDLNCLHRNDAGFFEPAPDTPAHDASVPVELILTPGLAFCPSGVRLGRGRGHYDRALPRFSHALRIGVCFACQMVERLEPEPHDQRMNGVVTEVAVHQCHVD